MALFLFLGINGRLCFPPNTTISGAAGTYCGGEEDEAVCGGPFSALCASMRPQEEEMEGFKVEVMTNTVSYFSLLATAHLRGPAQTLNRCTRGMSLAFGWRRRMDQKTAPASSSPFLLLRFSNEHIALSDMGRIKKTFPFLNFLSFDNKSKVLVKIPLPISQGSITCGMGSCTYNK